MAQHHGLRTFQIFQQKLATLSGDEPEQRALCRLLTYLVGSYIEAFTRNLCLSRSRIAPFNVCSTWSQASIFKPARSTGSPTSIALQRATSGIDRVKPSTGRDAEGNLLVQCHARQRRIMPPSLGR